ncbi:hypothetical protein ACTXT7_003742 [Hymenolepis weldensis]
MKRSRVELGSKHNGIKEGGTRNWMEKSVSTERLELGHLAQGISRVHLPPSATLECVVNDVLNRRMLRQHEGYAYRLEEWVDPDKKPTGEEAEVARKPLDLSMTIAEYTRNYASTHFALIREHKSIGTLEYIAVIQNNEIGKSQDDNKWRIYLEPPNVLKNNTETDKRVKEPYKEELIALEIIRCDNDDDALLSSLPRYTHAIAKPPFSSLCMIYHQLNIPCSSTLLLTDLIWR